MTISKEIATAQANYAAKPFAVRWVTSHFSGTFRFDTFDEAFDYVQEQWVKVQKQVRNNAYHSSKLWQSYIETPDGKMSVEYFLLAKDVSSY
jgi:hypothetical protein